MDYCSGVVSMNLNPSTHFHRDDSLLQLNEVGQLSVTDKKFEYTKYWKTARGKPAQEQCDSITITSMI